MLVFGDYLLMQVGLVQLFCSCTGFSFSISRTKCEFAFLSALAILLTPPCAPQLQLFLLFFRLVSCWHPFCFLLLHGALTALECGTSSVHDERAAGFLIPPCCRTLCRTC